MNEEGVKRLKCAAVMQAVRDYRSALYKYNTSKRKSCEYELIDTIKECEVFFRDNIAAFCSIDGERIIKKIQEETGKSLAKKGLAMEVPE